MKRAELIRRVKALNFPHEDYWVITGGAMVLYDLREDTHDIDLGCTARLADELEKRGAAVSRRADGSRKLVLDGDVEIMEGWLYDRVETVEDIPVISMQGLIEMKRSLGREKDLRDIRLIEQYLGEVEKR